jgi:pyridoxal 5'-phosphate synthase pdxT subunit
MRIGVLALQGGFRPHVEALEAIGHDAILVRDAKALSSIDGLVLCGGESTAQMKLIDDADLRDPLLAVLWKKPVFGTCAGAILLVRFGLLDVVIDRNAYGSQIHSFEAVSERGRPLVFIRAPKIRTVGPTVEVLDTFEGAPILVRQNRITAATFHPELTRDRTIVEQAFASSNIDS